MRYVEPRSALHRVEVVDGVEQLRIPFRRQWAVLLFLSFWLFFWTVGGIVAFWQLIETGEAFLALWMVGWAIGWLFAATTILSQFASEQLRVHQGDLEVRHGVGGLGRTWRYRGNAIHNLTSSEPFRDPFEAFRLQMPLLQRNRSGSVKFDYGADSIFLANGVGEPEGRQIADWLAKRLPGSAVSR